MTMTIDELMRTLLENPIPDEEYNLPGWNEQEIHELYLLDDDDLTPEKKQLRNLITKEVNEVAAKKLLPVPEKLEESEEVNVYELTTAEILQRINCRCGELKNQHLKKNLDDQYKEDDIDTVLNNIIKTNSETKHSKRIHHNKLKQLLKSPLKTRCNSVPESACEEGEEEEKEEEEEEEEEEEKEEEEEYMLSEKRGTDCNEFLNVKNYATSFVDDLLVEAQTTVNALLPLTKSQERDMCAEGSVELYSDSYSNKFSNSTIIQNKDFTPTNGRELILESIETWNLRKPWYYCINFIAENSDACTDFYKYEVIWSLPTNACPIPRATASVFYTIEVSRVKGDNCPVIVTFKFETDRYTFHLEDDIKHEVFLNSIIQYKTKFFQALRI